MYGFSFTLAPSRSFISRTINNGKCYLTYLPSTNGKLVSPQRAFLQSTHLFYAITSGYQPVYFMSLSAMTTNNYSLSIRNWSILTCHGVRVQNKAYSPVTKAISFFLKFWRIMGKIWESTGEMKTQVEGESLYPENTLGYFSVILLAYQEALARFISIHSVFDARDIFLASGIMETKYILVIFFKWMSLSNVFLTFHFYSPQETYTQQQHYLSSAF